MSNKFQVGDLVEYGIIPWLGIVYDVDHHIRVGVRWLCHTGKEKVWYFLGDFLGDCSLRKVN